MRVSAMMMETATYSSVRRRRTDDDVAATRRVGVIWSGEALTDKYRVPNIVLDISPDGAKLKTDMMLLGEVDTFRLSV
ncbi:MAG: hypothetical protein ACREFC_13515, partial [Stellaceae bacterium]